MKILLLTVFILFANCTNKLAIDHHGVNKLSVKQNKLMLNETNKNDIIKILGPPSTTSFFDNEILFFIEKPEFFRSYNNELENKIITITEKKLDEEVKNGNVLIRLYERLKID